MIKNLMNKKKKGFTLIELIIVIAIIAILAAIAVPQFSKIRQKANVNTDLSNAKSIHSIVSSRIADETIDVAVTAQEMVTLADDLDPTPVPKAYKGAKFIYSVDELANVQVRVVVASGAEFILYPKTNNTYGEAISKATPDQAATDNDKKEEETEE